MKIFIALAALLITVAGRAQTVQETITYSVQAEAPGTANNLPGDMQMVVYCKNGKSLTEMNSSLYSMKTLVTGSGTLVLMNTPGQKFFHKMAVPGLDSNDTAVHAIQYIDETKQIAGYACKKALVKINGEDAAIWYTDQLPVVPFIKEAAFFKTLKGMPLEFEMVTHQTRVKLTAQKVSTDNIPESTFQLSTDGYKELNGNFFKE